MNALKDIAKGGWKPDSDRPIHRDTWKSDLKGIATGKKHDPYEASRNHQSAPLTSLKDPDSFGPPPRHRAYYGDEPQTQSSSVAASSSAPTPSLPQKSTGGLGGPVPAPRPRPAPQDEEAEEPAPKLPYRMNTTGLQTDHLPKPPSFNGPRQTPNPSTSTSRPPAQPPRPQQQPSQLPPRQPPRRAEPTQLPPRQPPRPAAAEPTPRLPPRQNEYPDEHTPPPPPTYGEATRQSAPGTSLAADAAMHRLGQSGVSVPTLGIGSPVSSSNPTAPTPSPLQASQVSELQQRFARMNGGSSSPVPAPSASPNTSAAAAAQKKRPPPPPKKPGLASGSSDMADGAPGAPPPIPMGSKPRP